MLAVISRLTVTATTTENGSTANTSASLPIHVDGIANTPTLTVGAVAGNEDTPIALNIAAALTDTDGSETLNVTIGNIPTGATLSAGTLNAKMVPIHINCRAAAAG